MKRYRNLCPDCGKPVTVPGDNWAYSKVLKAHINQPFDMQKTGKIVGYYHRVCPDMDTDAMEDAKP